MYRLGSIPLVYIYRSETPHHHGDLEEYRHDNNRFDTKWLLCTNQQKGKTRDLVSHTHLVTLETRGCGLTSAALRGDVDSGALGDGESGENFGAGRVDSHREVKVLLGGSQFHSNSVSLGDFPRIWTQYLETQDPLL